MKTSATIETPTMSPTTIPTMVPGLSLFRVDPVCFPGEVVAGVESMVFGIAAIAGGEVGAEAFGGVEMVEGIGQIFFRGFPHNSGFPEYDSAA